MTSERKEGASDRSGTRNLMSDHPKLVAGAAVVGLARLVPLAAKGVGRLGFTGSYGVADVVKKPARAVGHAKSELGDKVKENFEEKIGEAGGPAGILKNTLKGTMPFGGGDGEDGGDGGGGGGVGEGRRMPVQQSVDIAQPLERVYNQWTQFEDWPNFMHRVTRVTQEDPCTISVAAKIWGKTKEFTAEIVTQRPDDCVKWRVTSGITHEGVVFFRELSPDLTRVELSLDVQPGNLAEKFARGARLVKRATRGDLHRFKAYVEMLDEDADGWRGTIEDGKVVRKRESRRASGKRSGSKSERSRSNGQHARSSGQRSRSSTSRSRDRTA